MPYLETGYDIQLFDVGDFYLTVSCSEQGEELLRNRHFEEGTEEDEERVETIKRKAVHSQREQAGNKRAIEILKEGKPDGIFWERLAERCINCGVVSMSVQHAPVSMSLICTRWWVHEIPDLGCLSSCRLYQGDQRA